MATALNSVYKTYTINKNSTDLAVAVTQCQFLILNFSTYNVSKFLHHAGSILKIWTALQTTVSMLYFLIYGFGRRVTLQFKKLCERPFL